MRRLFLLNRFWVQAVAAMAFFFCLNMLVLGVLSLPRAATGLFAMEMAIRPWEMGLFVVLLVLLGAFAVRRVSLRVLMELLGGFFLLFGVWFLAWWVWGEWGLFAAALFTVLQAWVRTVWMHNLFVLVGTVGAVAYLAFLLPLLTWVALLCFLAMSEVIGRRPLEAQRMARSVVHRGIVPFLLLPATVRGFMEPFVAHAQATSSLLIGVTALVLPGMVVAHLWVTHCLLAVCTVLALAMAAGMACVRQWSLVVLLAGVVLVSGVLRLIV